MNTLDGSYSEMLAKGIMFFWKKPEFKDFSVSTSQNREHRFILNVSGDCVFVFPDGTEKLPAKGSVTYIPPELEYRIDARSAEPEIIALSCFGLLADVFAASCNASAFFTSIRPTALDAFNALYSSLEDIEPGTENVNRTASEFYSLLMEIVFTPARIVESKPSVIAQKIKQYIEKNIDSDISVTSIAKQFYLSETHVIRIFREKYGITPKQYILKSKINASKLLLLDTSLQIKEIAMTYHFADSYHFSHTFKRFTGVSPEKYRLREDEKKK